MVLWANSKWRNIYLRKSWKFSKKLKTVVFETRPLPSFSWPSHLSKVETPLQIAAAQKCRPPAPHGSQTEGFLSGRSRTLALLISPQLLVVEVKFQVSEWEVRAPFFHLAPDCGLQAPHWVWYTENAVALTVIALTCEMVDHMWDINWEGLRLLLPSLAQSAHLLERGVTQRSLSLSPHPAPSPGSDILPGERNMLWNR